MNDFQILPRLSDSDYGALRSDIAARGVMVPIEVDEAGNILDGHHRKQISDELGIPCPRIVRAGLTEAEKRTHARQLNIARRHLSQDEKRALIAGELRDNTERSNRRIAAGLGVDDKTVGAVRSELEGTAEIPQLDKTTGADGKSRPAKKRAAQQERVAAELGRPARKAPRRTGFDMLVTAWRAATDGERERFRQWVTAAPKPGEAPIDEVVEVIRRGLRDGSVDDHDRGFATGVLRDARSGRWWPAPAQEARMRRIHAELKAESLIDEGDDG